MSEDQPQASKLDIKKVLGFAFAGLNLIALGVGSYLVYVSTLGIVYPEVSNKEAERELASFEEKLRGDPVLYHMESFNTNLDGVPRRLVRLELSLEMMDAEGFEEVIGMAPQARDAIMRILNAKTFDELETVQGKLQLKDQISTGLNAALNKGVVKNIYFTDFVVQ